MTYDILAFDPAATTDAGFDAWWKAESKWTEDHEYDDPSVTTPALRAFYEEITRTFPAMNGPDAPDEDEIEADPEMENRLADYCVGTKLVYVAFGWNQADTAAEAFERLGKKHGVAVAFVSDDCRIIRPE